MEDITPIKKLADLYNVLDFLPNTQTLNIKDYKKIKDYNTSDSYRSFLLHLIPRSSLPNKYLDAATLIDTILKSRDFLGEDSGIELPDEHFGMIYPYSPNLFEVITKYGKFPNRLLSNANVDLRVEVDNYYKASILDRFFYNKGQVFYSELLNISAVQTFTEDAFSKGKINYYDSLVQDRILRKALPNELHIILKFQTKERLLELIKTKISKSKSFAGPITSLSKDKLIMMLVDEKEIIDIGLHNHFYFLEDNIQEFKNWLTKEYVYYSIYDLFYSEFESSWIFIHSIMKDLIIINDDFETAFKLSVVFYKQLERYKRYTNFHAEWEVPRIEVQMKKINKHFKNKPLPTLSTIASDNSA